MVVVVVRGIELPLTLIPIILLDMPALRYRWGTLVRRLPARRNLGSMACTGILICVHDVKAWTQLEYSNDKRQVVWFFAAANQIHNS